VVAPGLVVTNAHVVAGVPSPEVLDGTGHHHTTVVLFDPRLDLAVLRVPGLTDPSLPIDTAVVGRGTSGVVLGFPEGGPFDYKPAAVADPFTATGLDIYGNAQTVREVYQIDAEVRPGNSGGPLIASGDGAQHIPDATVIGVVFARSTINPDVGYALAMAAVEADIRRVGPSTGPVSTGGCIAD
jgi:S1-C subfamily serine protease